MPNNTLTYWEADGVSLHTYAWSIETMGGMAIPAFRGEDIIVPLRNGEVWVPKKFSSNVITLSMWIRGATDGAGAFQETQQMYEEKYNDLVRLLWTPGRQFALTKRFYDQGSLRVATAMAEFSGGLAPVKRGRAFGRCTIDLKIAGGVFYAAAATTVNLVDGDQTIVVPGQAPARIKITINGARNQVRIRNKTLGVDFIYNRSVLAGQVATIDVDNYEVVDSTYAYDPGPELINNTGDAAWLVLAPGNNVINVSSTSGAGVVSLEYRAGWV